VHEVQARERQDAGLALSKGENTIRAFEAVVATCLLLALLAATNMAWAVMRSHRLTHQNKVLTRLTQVDALTGLGNRRCFDETLAAAWTECTARQSPLTLVLFDIDHFKKFNDSQGHQAGDACLRRVSEALRGCTRDDMDQAARYGGEEFAIILPNSPIQAGRAVAERVRKAVAGCAIAHPAAPPPGIVTVSLGVASLIPTASGAAATLIEAADQALYAAKRSGRNRVCEAPIEPPREAADEGDLQACQVQHLAISSSC
jgi:diguanylate cyclase (GGDEF)-like protein